MGDYECPDCGETFEAQWLLRAHTEDLECSVVSCSNDANRAATFDNGIYKPYCDGCLSGTRADLVEDEYRI
jgi:hypothetical protein